MRVLTFTSLYPNNVWPYHGVFTKERMTPVAALEGCEVKVIAPVPYFPPLKLGHRFLFSQVRRQEVIEGLEVYHPRYFMIPKVGMTLQGALMFLSVLPTVREIQKDFDFDLIDAHFVYPDGFAAVLLGHFFRKPVVVSALGSEINLYKEFPLIRRLLRYTLGKATQVIAVSQALKDTMGELGGGQEKVIVVPNGVNPKKFYPFSRQEARSRLGLPEGRLLLSVGHLTPVKGFDLLLRAFKMLGEHCHDLSLVVVGEGPLRNQLEQEVATLGLRGRVHLVGKVLHEDLYVWYNAADLFCLASSREGWPNVLMEALACGTPVVATAVGGIPEIVRSSAVGLLAARNEGDLAAKISLALKNPWQRETIVRYALERTQDRVALTLSQIFASVLRGGAAQL